MAIQMADGWKCTSVHVYQALLVCFGICSRRTRKLHCALQYACVHLPCCFVACRACNSSRQQKPILGSHAYDGSLAQHVRISRCRLVSAACLRIYALKWLSCMLQESLPSMRQLMHFHAVKDFLNWQACRFCLIRAVKSACACDADSLQC